MRPFSILAFLCFFLGSCSPHNLKGTVIASKDIGEGIRESLVQTGDEQVPYFKIRTNSNNFQVGSKVVLEAPESAP
jgi:hypothetical protein